MPAQTNQPSFQPGHIPSTLPSGPPPAWYRHDDDLDLAQLLQILRRRGLIIGGVAITVASLIWAWTLTRTPVYQGRFRVLIESVDEADRSQQLLLEEQIQLQSTVDYDTQIEVLLSPVLLKPISQELRQQYPNLTPERIAEGLSINRLRETKVLEVTYRGTDPQVIQAVLEEVAQHYLDYSFEQRQASLRQGIEFVDEQLPELRDRVNTLQVRLERFRQQYSLLDPENRGSDLSELISQVEEQRQQLQTELSQARSLYRSLQSQLQISPEEALAAAALSESPRYQSLLNQIQELEAQIAVESAKYQPGSPQIESLRDRRDNLVPLLESEAADILGDRFAPPGGAVDGNLTPTSIDLSRQLINAANEVQMLQARSQTLAQVEQDLKQEFSLVPALARQYTDLQRELNIATESLNRFLTTRETLQIDAAQKSIPWQLIADPTTSRIPISPNVPRNMMLGLMAGVLVGAAAALLAEKLDQVYHSPDELKLTTPFPLLGSIPFHPTLQERQSADAETEAFQQNGSSASTMPAGSTASRPIPRQRSSQQAAMFFEAFRSLYTNVRFLGTDEPIRSVVISSAIPGEGKSTVALYLAKAAAVMGQRVLLVDADLRSPKHHTRLNLPNMRGLGNVIAEAVNVQDVVQRSPLDSNLFVLTAGPTPPDPVKLLSSQRMRSLMDQLHSSYDLVVYDMPPMLGFADSSLVASHTDGMIVVVGLGKTERSIVARALDEIRLSPVPVLGMVANGIKSYTTQIYGYSRYYRNYPNVGQAELQPSGAIAPAASPSVPASPEVPSAPHQDPYSETSWSNATASQSSAGWQYQEFTNSADDPAQGAYETLTQTSAHRKAAAPRSSARAAATVQRQPVSLLLLAPWQMIALGTGAVVLLGGLGWTVFSRLNADVPDSPPTPPEDVAQPPEPSPAPIDSPDEPFEDPLVEPTQPEGVESNGSESVEPPTPPDVEASAPDPETTEPSDPPALSPGVQDPFTEAVRIAEQAVAAGEQANTPEEWASIAEQWQRAAALMAIVPQTDERFTLARDRTVLYRNNGEFARQQVLELLSTKNLSDLDSDSQN